MIAIPNDYPPQLGKDYLDGCVLYSDMQDTGDKLLDHSGYNNHGINYNSVPICNNGWVRRFNGINAKATYQTLPISQTWTFVLALRLLETQAAGVGIISHDSSINNAYTILLYKGANNNNIYLYVATLQGAVNTPSTADTLLEINRYYIIACSFNRYQLPRLKFYKNGKVAATHIGLDSDMRPLTDTFNLAWRYFQGDIFTKCDIGFIQAYNRELSQAEISYLFNRYAPQYDISW